MYLKRFKNKIIILLTVSIIGFISNSPAQLTRNFIQGIDPLLCIDSTISIDTTLKPENLNTTKNLTLKIQNDSAGTFQLIVIKEDSSVLLNKKLLPSFKNLINKKEKICIYVHDLDKNNDNEIILYVSSLGKNELYVFYHSKNRGWYFSDYIGPIKGNIIRSNDYLVNYQNNDTILYQFKYGKFISTEQIEMAKEKLIDDKLTSWASNLRIRSEPKFRAQVEGKLSKNEKVSYLGESVDCKIFFQTRGLNIENAAWMKIKKDELTGWVYSPYLLNLIRINNLNVYPEDDYLVFKDAKNDTIFFKHKLNMLIDGVNQVYVQGFDYVYDKPFLIVYPYGPRGKQKTYFNTLVVDVNKNKLISKFQGIRYYRGASVNNEFLLFSKHIYPYNDELLVYSTSEKKAIDKITPYFYTSWNKNAFEVFYQTPVKHSKNIDDGPPVEFFLQKTLWDASNLKNTPKFEQKK